MKRLLVGVLALMVVTAGLLTSDRGAYAADSILTDVLRRGTVRIAISTGAPPTRFEDENAIYKATTSTSPICWRSSSAFTIEWIGRTRPAASPCCRPKRPI